MKTKAFLFLLLSLSLGACKKTYTCHCVHYLQYTDTRSFDVTGKDVSSAEADCVEQETSTEHCYLDI